MRWFVVGVIIAFLLGCFCGCDAENGAWQRKCVDKGFGEYDSKTGEFKMMLIDVKQDGDG